jgi:NAD(P)-dependent dehydrogenase (short-subunit alcohol dehydrogenase family)
MRRTGQVVVVLGGSGGLGSGLARRFALDGADVVLADIDRAELAATAAALSDESPGAVVAVPTDVADPADVESLARTTLDRFGRIDVVCNTVAVIAKGRAWEIGLQDWRWQLDVNLLGVVNVIRAFTPALLQQGHGHLVHTSSTVALTSTANNAAYVATKHAVLGLCEALQQDLRATGSEVIVSVLIPGAIRSRLYAAHRNRQAQYGGSVASETSEARADREYLEDYGADPDVLAGILMAQLDEGRFYVYGRPGDVRYSDERAAGLRTGHLPTPAFVREPGPGSRAQTRQPGAH